MPHRIHEISLDRGNVHGVVKIDDIGAWLRITDKHETNHRFAVVLPLGYVRGDDLTKLEIRFQYFVHDRVHGA